VVWLNVGRREKRLFSLILPRDEPRGRPITIWGAVCTEFKIDYDPFTQKCKQLEAFREEQYVRQSFNRMFRNGWAKPVWAVETGFSLTPTVGDGADFTCCILTAKGRLVAEQLQRQEQAQRVKEVTMRKVLDTLRGLGFVYVTAEQICDFLWKEVFHEFRDREAFDKYWNGTKLGIVLRRCGIRRARISRLDGRRKYCLTPLHS